MKRKLADMLILTSIIEEEDFNYAEQFTKCEAHQSPNHTLGSVMT
jgi:hypothetical protein